MSLNVRKAYLLAELANQPLTLTDEDWQAWQLWVGFGRQKLPYAGGYMEQPSGAMRKLFMLDNIAHICELLQETGQEATTQNTKMARNGMIIGLHDKKIQAAETKETDGKEDIPAPPPPQTWQLWHKRGG